MCGSYIVTGVMYSLMRLLCLAYRSILQILTFHFFFQDLSSELLSTVFELGMVLSFADTEVFPALVSYLSSHQNEKEYLNAQKIMTELMTANKPNEAKMVDKECGVNSQGIRTLGAAVGAMSAIGRWWKKN